MPLPVWSCIRCGRPLTHSSLFCCGSHRAQWSRDLATLDRPEATPTAQRLLQLSRQLVTVAAELQPVSPTLLPLLRRPLQPSELVLDGFALGPVFHFYGLPALAPLSLREPPRKARRTQ